MVIAGAGVRETVCGCIGMLGVGVVPRRSLPAVPIYICIYLYCLFFLWVTPATLPSFVFSPASLKKNLRPGAQDTPQSCGCAPGPSTKAQTPAGRRLVGNVAPPTWGARHSAELRVRSRPIDKKRRLRRPAGALYVGSDAFQASVVIRLTPTAAVTPGLQTRPQNCGGCSMPRGIGR